MLSLREMKTRSMKKLPVVLAALALGAPFVMAEDADKPEEIVNYVREWFSGRDFSKGDEISGVFHQSRLNGANFRGMEFDDVSFEACDLADADMRDAVFGPGTKFFRCTLNGADLRNVDFAGASIESVNFRGADLREAKNLRNVRRANFQRADLRGADLSQLAVPLQEIEMEDAIYNEKTKFPQGLDPAAEGAILAR